LSEGSTQQSESCRSLRSADHGCHLGGTRRKT
jgi:hypothetical protein